MKYEIKNITNEYELDRALNFSQSVFVKHNIIGNRQLWLERMKANKELLLYAESSDEIIAVVFAYLENNGNITVEIVVTDERYRRKGIAKEMMFLIEERAKNLGVHLIALGATETSEEFYIKLGYTGQLLIQSENHTIDELLSLNPGYPVAFTNIYEGTINQICLKLQTPDRKLQRLYESTYDGCYTQTMFWKII